MSTTSAYLSEIFINKKNSPVFETLKENYFPYFQPIVELSKGEIAGYEALARTRNKQGDVISAGGLFFNDTYSEKMLVEIDRHIRRLALSEFFECDKNSFLTLNISPNWVDRLSFDDISPTLDMIHQLGIDPQRVVVEITEKMGDIEKLKWLSKQYHQYGVKVAIDDLGAGASQLDRIAELEPELIKLDMHLLKAATKGGIEADIALSIAALAKRAGSQIVCEGVETEDEFNFAIECGADFIQGWLYEAALEKPIDSQTTVNTTGELKKSYLQRKCKRLFESAEHNRHVSEQVMVLCSVLRDIENKALDSGALDFKKMKDLGIIRYYICGNQATQISPNYEVVESGVVLDSNKTGCNWSHRPYFPLLLGMQGVVDDHIVVSDPYRDCSGGEMCKTYGIFISRQRVLFIDVRVDDVILFSEN